MRARPPFPLRAAVWSGVLLLLALGCGRPDPSIPRIEDARIADSPELIRLSGSGSAVQRARAARAMGRIQSAAYAEALAAAATEGSVEVRVEALFALGQLGLAVGATPPARAVEVCRAAAGDAEPRIARRAVEALGKLAAPDGLAAVVAALDHTAPAVRAAAAMALFRYRFVPLWRRIADEAPALPADAAAALIAAAGDAAPEVRRAAIYACSRYAQPGIEAAAAGLLADGDEWTRLFAVRALGRSGRATHAAGVATRLADPSPRVRAEAALTLARLELPGAAARAAADGDRHVRAAVATALGADRDPATLETLRTLERDAASSVRTAAIAALAARLGSSYAGTLARHLDDPLWNVRAAAAAAATQAGPRALGLIETALEDNDRRVRVAALGALAGRDDADALVERYLASDDLAERGTAIGVLAERDRPDKLARLATAYDASPGVTWIEIRESIVDAVATLDGALPLLERMTGDEAASVRRRARLALRAAGRAAGPDDDPPNEPSPLLGRLLDHDPLVVLETSKGEIAIRCFADAAPLHVAGFVELARNGFYDGTIWHRVVPNFVIQGGDPRGDGWGGAGYTLRDEINMRRYGRGTVGMPKAGKDTGGGQIFITHVPTPHLDGNYTVFGNVERGIEVVDRIEVGDTIVRARVE